MENVSLDNENLYLFERRGALITKLSGSDDNNNGQLGIVLNESTHTFSIFQLNDQSTVDIIKTKLTVGIILHDNKMIILEFK